MIALEESQIKFLAFNCFDESEGENAIAVEARYIWQMHKDGKEPSRELKYFTVEKLPRLKRHTDVVKESQKDVCSECRGRGIVSDPYWEAKGLTMPCPVCKEVEYAQEQMSLEELI